VSVAFIDMGFSSWEKRGEEGRRRAWMSRGRGGRDGGEEGRELWGKRGRGGGWNG